MIQSVGVPVCFSLSLIIYCEQTYPVYILYRISVCCENHGMSVYTANPACSLSLSLFVFNLYILLTVVYTKYAWRAYILGVRHSHYHVHVNCCLHTIECLTVYGWYCTYIATKQDCYLKQHCVWLCWADTVILMVHVHCGCDTSLILCCFLHWKSMLSTLEEYAS